MSATSGAMLTLSNLTVRVAGRPLIEDASVAIPAGARVGFLGRNGTGKTTLFNVIVGEYGQEAGDVFLPSGARIGRVAQEAPGGPISLIDFVLAADVERARLLAEAETATDPSRIADIQMRLVDISAHAAPARAGAILNGLGFDDAAQRRPCSEFSGGWRMRVALAAVLFAEPDLLLLDEPTNYLDLEGALWLQDYLARYPHTMIVISHDRDLLDSSVEHILHLDERKLTLWRGAYSTFERSRRMAAELRDKAIKKQGEKRAALQAFVDRFRAKASKARQAQSRLKMLEKMESLEAIVDRDVAPFPIPDPVRKAAPPIVAMEGVAVGYEPGKPVLSRLDLRIDDDDRIGLLGANGNGKSTFVKLVSGRLAPQSGRFNRAEKLKVAYFAQHQLDELRPEESVAQHFFRAAPNEPVAKVRAAAARAGFSGDRAEARVASLSGGEKARLLFALAVREGPHLLILDEPTNHLDIDSRAALIEALNAYSGAVIIVSHDRRLLEASVDRLWLVAEGRVKPFDGDLDDYRRLVLAGPSTSRPAKQEAATAPFAPAAKAAERNVRKEEPSRKEAARRLRDVEAAMGKLSAEIEKIDRILGQPGFFEAHPNNAAEALRVRADRAERLAALEEEWLMASEAVEGSPA